MALPENALNPVLQKCHSDLLHLHCAKRTNYCKLLGIKANCIYVVSFGFFFSRGHFPKESPAQIWTHFCSAMRPGQVDHFPEKIASGCGF